MDELTYMVDAKAFRMKKVEESLEKSVKACFEKDCEIFQTNQALKEAMLIAKKLRERLVDLQQEADVLAKEKQQRGDNLDVAFDEWMAACNAKAHAEVN